MAQSELRVSWVATIVMLLCTLQLIDYVYAAVRTVGMCLLILLLFERMFLLSLAAFLARRRPVFPTFWLAKCQRPPTHSKIS